MGYVKEFFHCCRTGNLANLRSLVEQHGMDLNLRDKWDSTPLYYACLCGHERTVEYLLQNGAVCEANTFDGERCLYSALTQKIKEMLRDYKAVTKDCIKRDSFVEFFKQSLANQSYKDFYFVVHGCHIFVDKIVLFSRSSYFAHMFETKWKNRRYIHLKHPLVTVSAFQFMVQYLYTARIHVPVADVELLKKLCQQCQLTELGSKLDTALHSFHHYANSKPKILQEKMSILSIHPNYNSLTLNQSYDQLASRVIPTSLQDDDMVRRMSNNFELENNAQPPPFADLCFDVNGHHFYGHKFFFCGRSEYFKTLLHFSETVGSDIGTDGSRTNIKLNDISARSFAIVVAFVYTDKALVPDDLVDELLHFSSLYLLHGLKRLCASQLERLLSTGNVVDVVTLSRLYNLVDLEASCCEFMANHLNELVTRSEFAELILSDANAIADRHETDTITVIDDIRYHIHKSELPGMLVDLEQSACSADEKLQMLDHLLTQLNLEC